MKSTIESFIARESVWPDYFDDRIIDDMIWSEINSSPSAGDFSCYPVHRPQRARHIDEARARYESIDHRLDTAPACNARAIEHNPAMARKLYEGGVAAGNEECEFALARLPSQAVQPPAPVPSSLN